MIRVLALTLAALAVAPNAYAHSDGMPIGPYELWHHWSFDPWVWVPLLLGHWLYGRGVLRAWARAGRGRIIARWRVWSFVAGELALVMALISPIDPLGETLLSAHMTQHLLLTGIAPTLLVLGMPVTAWTWALPASWRPMARSSAVRAMVQAWRHATRPLTATLLHALALWAWHAPILFDAALENDAVHVAEHATFFVSGLIFWSAMLQRNAPPLLTSSLVLVTFVHMGVLAAILALSPIQLYAYGDFPMLWGLSGLEDQQLAGLIMWAPAGGVYLLSFALLASRLFDDESQGIIRASTSSRSMK